MYSALTSWENLLLAFREASRGKRRHPHVAAFEHRLEDQLIALQAELVAQTYQPGPYSSFFIHEPKRRLISAAPFRDRVVHHALVQVIEPAFERSFIADTYANRRGKGTHRALDRCQQLARRHPFVLQLDLSQFFPSIDHAVLRSILAAKIPDEGILWLTDRILASGQGVLSEVYDMIYFPGDNLFSINRPRGLPIGNLTSQFWGNVILSPVDHFAERELRCPGYVRYVDDLLIFGNDKRSLWAAKRGLVKRLEALRLAVHSGAHPRPVQEGIPFLGFVVFPQRRRLKRRKGVAFSRRLSGLAAGWRGGEIALESVAASVESWENHARYGNTTGLRKAILATAPTELRELLNSPGTVKRSSASRGRPVTRSMRRPPMMDLPTLAADVVAYLTPFLPYLQQAGGKVAEEVGKKFGEGVWERAKALWTKVGPEIAAKDHARGAVEVLAKRPEDSRAKGAVELQLEEILAAKPGLASEVAQLLKAAGPRATWAHLVGDGAIAQGDGAVAAGKGGIAAGRDVMIGTPWPGTPGGPRERE